MRLLLVDDDVKLIKVLKPLLSAEHYIVDTAHDGGTAESKALTTSYDAIVLDLTLPEKDGLTVCETLRSAGSDTPIIMLTGRTTPRDKVAGLDSGADDYLAKPFSPTELLARLRAVMRRPTNVLPSVLQVADLELDPSRHTVQRASEPIALMPKEYALLEYMMRRPNEVLKRQELLHHVWGVYYQNSSNRLEVYIRYLREKIDEPFDKPLIHTIRGTGYMLTDETVT